MVNGKRLCLQSVTTGLVSFYGGQRLYGNEGADGHQSGTSVTHTYFTPHTVELRAPHTMNTQLCAAERESRMDPTSGAGGQPAVAVAAAPASAGAAGAVTSAATLPPPEKVLRSVRRTVVNVAAEAGPRVISGVWAFFQKFSEAVNNKGKNNTWCMIFDENGKECGRMYKHIGKNGTRPLLDHLKSNHPEEYLLANKASNRTKEAKQAKGEAFAAAGGKGGSGVSSVPLTSFLCCSTRTTDPSP